MLLHGQRPPFRVSHVLFDVDGTLVDYGLAIRAAFAAAAEAASTTKSLFLINASNVTTANFLFFKLLAKT